MILNPRTKNIKIDIDLTVLLVILLEFMFGYLDKYLIILLSMFVHECGHIFVSKLFGNILRMIRVTPIGLNAIIDQKKNEPFKNIFILISGPITNILIALVLSILLNFSIFNSKLLFFVIYVNIFLVLFNLIPIYPFDGGKIIVEFLSIWFGYYNSNRITQKLSYVFSTIIIIIGIFQIILNFHNFSLMIVGLYILFMIKYKNPKSEWILMQIRGVLCKQTCFAKNDVCSFRGYVVKDNMLVNDLIKTISMRKICVYFVLDDNLRFKVILTEQSIVDGLIKYGVRAKLKDLL